MKRYSETHKALFRSEATAKMTGTAEKDEYLHRMVLGRWIAVAALLAFGAGTIALQYLL